jgi:hypothetical protein
MTDRKAGVPQGACGGEVPRLRFVVLPCKRADEVRGRGGAAAEEESDDECEARRLPKNIRESSILSSSYQVVFVFILWYSNAWIRLRIVKAFEPVSRGTFRTLEAAESAEPLMRTANAVPLKIASEILVFRDCDVTGANSRVVRVRIERQGRRAPR